MNHICKKTAVGFGAALALPALPAHAVVVDLAFSQNTVAAGSQPRGIVEASITITGVGFGASFGQFNNAYGQSLLGNGGLGFWYYTNTTSIVSAGQTFYSVFTTYSGSGTKSFGFRAAGGELGWLRINFGGLGNDVQYLAGAVQTNAGQSIRVGETAPVPLPATAPLAALGVLALGAAGVRRKRKKAA